MDRRLFIGGAGAGALSLILPSILNAEGEGRSKPNILFFLADDLGYECVGAYGGQSYDTPNIDKLAEEGMIFNHCYSQPNCTPSRVKLLTGKYNFRNYQRFNYLDIGDYTLGHILKNEGYATAIAGKWQLGNGIEGPKLAGFDESCVWNIYSSIAGEDTRGFRYTTPKLYLNGLPMENTLNKYGPDLFSKFIANFINKNREKPFFAFYPMVLPHKPHSPTPDSKEWDDDPYQRNVKFFADQVKYMDKIIGRMVKRLDTLGVRNNTVIIFCADNGTSKAVSSIVNGETIQGGKGETKLAGTHVPLIVNWKNTIQPGSVNDELIDFSDFFMTVSEISGHEIREDLKLDGISFAPQLVQKTGKQKRDFIFMHHWKDGTDHQNIIRCIYDKTLKLYEDGRIFNLEKDPYELKSLSRNDLTEDQMKKVEYFREILLHFKYEAMEGDY